MPQTMRNTVVKKESDTEIDYLATLPYWSVITAYGYAAAERVRLTAEHLEVVLYLRKYYAQYGPHYRTLHLLDVLSDAFATQGGYQYLYQLFPKGPILQATRIAGLPLPFDSQSGVLSVVR